MQEFAAAVEQLAHRAFVGLPADHIQTEAAHAFIDGIRDREVKQQLLLGGVLHAGRRTESGRESRSGESGSVANSEAAGSD
jgi:hypothetical protein